MSNLPGTITPKQQRYIRYWLKVQPDFTMGQLRGRRVEQLSLLNASAIIDACVAKFGAPKRGEQQERQQDRQQEQRLDEQHQEREQEQEREQNDERDEQEQQNPYRENSKQGIIFEYLRKNGFDVEATMRALDHDGRIGQGKLEFSENVGGSRQPLALGQFHDRSNVASQYGRARKTVYAVKAATGEQQQRQQQNGGSGEQQQERHEQKQDGGGQNQEAMDFLRWIQSEVRPFLDARKADGHAMDEWGMRQAIYGAKLLTKGVPVAYLKHTATLHFPAEARRTLGVRAYDPTKFRKEQRREGMHASLPLCLSVCEAGVPLALIGPKGTGKTTLARQIAEVKGLPFGMVSMTNGTSPSAFTGRVTIDGSFVASKFQRIFSGGGVFLFDEMDAGAANLLLLLNAALANGVFENPVTGDAVEQHEDFIPVAGMNTMGLGAGRDYTGRNRLDAATLDRWSMGRVEVVLDADMERGIFEKIIAA